MIQLRDIFNVSYGTKLDLNKLEQCDGGVRFVSRTSQNNGVSAKVKQIEGVPLIPAGSISVSLGGSKLLASFVQDEPFYTAQNVAVLLPKFELSLQQKLYICKCIEFNRFRYSAFGREANRTIKFIEIPDLTDFPSWIDDFDPLKYLGKSEPLSKSVNVFDLKTTDWRYFRYGDIFDIERGRGPRIKDLDGTGTTPFITSTDRNNGLTGTTPMLPIHKGNVLSVNRNGSVAEAFYQEYDFCSTEDVHIFNPKFEMNKYVAMFLVTLIRREKYRYSYGRKWGIGRMNESLIKLPVDVDGNPDWAFMEQFIKTLEFSSAI